MDATSTLALACLILGLLMHAKALYTFQRARTAMPEVAFVPFLWLMGSGFFLGIPFKVVDGGPAFVTEHLSEFCFPVALALVVSISWPHSREDIHWGFRPEPAYLRQATRDYAQWINYLRGSRLIYLSGIFLSSQILAKYFPGGTLEWAIVYGYDWLDVVVYVAGAIIGLVIITATRDRFEFGTAPAKTPSPQSYSFSDISRYTPVNRLKPTPAASKPGAVQDKKAPGSRRTTGKPARTTGHKPHYPAETQKAIQRRARNKSKSRKPKRR